ncbi:MAG: ADP-ribosylglycohydrolase family protein [Gemmataceae bacterium]
MSLAVAALVAGEPAADVLTATARTLESYQPGLGQWLEQVLAQPLEALDLDEGLNPGEEDRIGYTLKALGAGMWSLAHAGSFAEGIDWIVHEGGDADTNAAVAGALLGARHGFSAIPAAWVNGLACERELRVRADRLLRILAVGEPKTPPA